MIGFEKRNVNPKNRKTPDCVVRALAVATGKAYADVYRELFDVSLATGYMLNEKRVEDKVLAGNGFVKHKQPRKADGAKHTIGEVDELTGKRGIVVIRCAHHLTAVIDGVLIDTWDCRGKCISNYYTYVPTNW